MNRVHPIPDFHCQGLLGEFFVEATTVNPSVPAVPITPENREDYFNNYIPIKFSGVLTAKLKKRYWEQAHVSGSPLLLAVQDFHAPGSMVWSGTALVEYLYGIHPVEKVASDGSIEVAGENILEYRWGTKAPIPAGFFLQPESENISAVLANPSGTISKFNRMGFIAGFGNREIRMLRKGLCFRDSRPPEEFMDEVHADGYHETWGEGMSVYHNPNALHPLEPIAFPDAAHHTVRNGRIVSNLPDFHPVASRTHIVVGV